MKKHPLLPIRQQIRYRHGQGFESVRGKFSIFSTSFLNQIRMRAKGSMTSLFNNTSLSRNKLTTFGILIFVVAAEFFLHHYLTNISLPESLVKGKGKVCVVVRTYHKHASGYYRLVDSLTSLMQQTYTEWEALVFQTDDVPFPELEDIIANLGDSRIRRLNLGLHRYSHGESAYSLTDKAITHCSEESKWLVVTNGDNQYHPLFLSSIDARSDVTTVNWYTRYSLMMRPKREALCSRWDGGTCRVNRFQFARTDLGSVILSLDRWRKESLKFSEQVPNSMQDGQLYSRLRNELLWKVHHVNRCLFHHNPNPRSCNAKGGIWKEHGSPPWEGLCVTPEEAARDLESGRYIAYHSTEEGSELNCMYRS
uniref:Uncharacterized protein n=2 Tax=Tetraselmis sp. GSL018 TaxID=582737 RepID=A0A061QLB4_9CHLO|mmetsp:Transcript_11472/g.27243  ORF Transcript_11472/g.27243 Transcript_11472/m.27243 type:complete len:366 (+) Transcript_11472:135-1232(+)